MSNLIIINKEKNVTTLPTQKYCFKPQWECDDEVHCAGERLCGVVEFINAQGQTETMEGICDPDTTVTIMANTIVNKIGVEQVNCPNI